MQNRILNTDALTGLRQLADGSVDCIVTSPPYWQMRDYGIGGIEWADGWFGQLGLEPIREQYLTHLLSIFDECHRVLKPMGTMWVNLGDSYNNSLKYSLKPAPQTISKGNNRQFVYGKNLKSKVSNLPQKSLCNIPGKFADEMILRGWILRNEIIWHKPSCIPASVKDRFTVDFEKMFFFTKQPKYLFNQQFEPYAESTIGRYRYPLTSRGKSAYYQQNSGTPRGMLEVNPDGRNKRCVWTLSTASCKDAHFATFPIKLVETPILAGSPDGGIVLDPFAGGGTTLVAAKNLGRSYIGTEPSAEYVAICHKRLA